MFTLEGDPAPSVTQDTSYNGKILYNSTTQKLEIAEGLPAGMYPVVLTASNGISPAAAHIFMLTVSADSLTTLFEGGNGQNGVMFDMEVIGNVPITVDSFDINLLKLPETTCTVSVFYRAGGYAGHETNASEWTFLGSQTDVPGAGNNLPTPLAVGGFSLQPGIRYGFYFVVSGTYSSFIYTDKPAGTVYSDDHLKIISGIGRGEPNFSGNIYSDRAWNGTVYYTPYSGDATLSNLTVGGATLNEAFSPDTTAYTAATRNTSVTLGASVNNPNATMTLQAGTGTPFAWDGSASIQNLNVGVNVFTITVFAKDGITEKTYTLTVTRNIAPTLTGSMSMNLTPGYSAVSTAAYTLTGTPEPSVTQDTTYGGRIVWNNATKKLDIAAGLAVGSYPVVLTASNGISPAATLTFTLTVGAQGALTTIFKSDNRYAGNMFDMEVVGAYPILINSFDVNLTSYNGNTTCTVRVYYREGGYAGHESNASAWTLVGSQSGITPAGTDQPTPLNVGGVTLQPGIRCGFYVTVSDYSATGCQMQYTDMPVGTEYSDGILKIIAGNGRGNPDFTGNLYSGRMWNGTVHYTAITQNASISGPAELTLSEGYASAPTAAFELKGIPAPTVTQDKTYGGKIVWNNTTKKLDIAAGLAPGTYPVKLTADNGVSSASMTFTLTILPKAGLSRNLTGITPPAAITGLANGTARTIDALGLPLTAALMTDAGSEVGSVTWDLTSCAYTPSVKTAQTFTATGTVTLPLNVANPNRIPLTVTVSVTVNAAPAVSAASTTASASAPTGSTVSGSTSAASVPAMGSGGSALPFVAVMTMLAAAGGVITIAVRRRDRKVK